MGVIFGRFVISAILLDVGQKMNGVLTLFGVLTFTAVYR
jgi:hypothetical protein